MITRLKLSKFDFKPVESLPADSKICIYGAGGGGLKIKRELERRRNDIRIRCFMDSHKTGNLDGIEIITAEGISAVKNKVDFFLIASNYAAEIALSLLKSGITHFTFAPSGNTGSGFTKCLVIEEARLIYIRIPKVANNSIMYSLCSALGYSEKQLLDSFQKDIDVNDPLYANYFKFSFVRNPWDRLVSCFEDKLNSGAERSREQYVLPMKQHFEVDELTFDLFLNYIDSLPDQLANKHWRSQYTFLYDSRMNPVADFVGRYENLENDFAEVCDRIGIQANLQHRNASRTRKGDFRNYYDDRSRALVTNRYRMDIDEFNYQSQFCD